jgi:hypothetical protein
MINVCKLIIDLEKESHIYRSRNEDYIPVLVGTDLQFPGPCC